MGASVSPALFIAGFSLDSRILPKVFALVELLRGVAAFMVAPVLLHVAQTTGGSPVAGLKTSLWVSLVIAAAGGIGAVVLLLLGRARLQRPDIDRWQKGEGPAWHSPRLAAALRGELAAPDPESGGQSVDGRGSGERIASRSRAQLP